ncbi:DNA-directed RNA polymerase subunit alpha [Coprothermobacteraceae bacterium]|nr:DNA-directed RNA polymerase subunit alpha [Coprothermobacteraceae bacterium]
MEKKYTISDQGRFLDRETGETQRVARLEVVNLREGMGLTLGNALRRVLLGQIPGTGVIGFKLDGLDHEFMSLEGVVEDGLNIGLNLKKMVMRYHGSGVKKLYLKAQGPKVVKAGDMVPDADVEILNPAQTIMTISTDREVYMEVYVANGVGYQSVEDNKALYPVFEVKTIILDTSFSPVRRVEYQVVPAIVEEPGVYENLELTVYTNLSADPAEVIRQAADILAKEFASVSGATTEAKEAEVVAKKPFSEAKLAEALDVLKLSRAVMTHLEKAGITTVGELLSVMERGENIPGIGATRLEEIRQKLTAYLEGGAEDEA